MYLSKKNSKCPKSLCKSNRVFALYAPRRIKLEPGNFINVPMNNFLLQMYIHFIYLSRKNQNDRTLHNDIYAKNYLDTLQINF